MKRRIINFSILKAALKNLFKVTNMKKYILYTMVFNSPMYFEPFTGKGFKLTSDKKLSEIYLTVSKANDALKELELITGYKIEITKLSQ